MAVPTATVATAGTGRERLRLSWALLLAGACLLVYANSLTGGFVYDDKAIVRDNFRIRAPSRVGEIFATQYFGGPRGTGTAYRPLLLLSFAVQWWIHGADPLPFHAANLLIHAAATLLLAALLLRLRIAPPVAVGAALLFAVHPVHVEAVAGLVGRGKRRPRRSCWPRSCSRSDSATAEDDADSRSSFRSWPTSRRT